METNSCNLTTRVFCGCVCSSIMLRGGETRTVARYFCMRSHRPMSRTSCHLHCLLMFNYANAAIASLKQFEIFYEYLYLDTSMSVMSHYHKLLIRSTKLIEYVCMSFQHTPTKIKTATSIIIYIIQNETTSSGFQETHN